MATDRQTDRQTNKQMDSPNALSRSRCRERPLNNMKLVCTNFITWPLTGGLLQAPPRCAKITAHPSTSTVPITVLLYNGPLLCVFNVPIKWLILQHIVFVFCRCYIVLSVKPEQRTSVGACKRWDWRTQFRLIAMVLSTDAGRSALSRSICRRMLSDPDGRS